MPCEAGILRAVQLFAPLGDAEIDVLAAHVELKTFEARQRIYRIGDASGRAYVMVSGAVRLTTVDQDQQDVVVDEPPIGEFFGFASMLDGTPHQTSAVALERSVCLEIDRDDISTLVSAMPHAAMEMFAVLGRQFHEVQRLVRVRTARSPNEIIEAKATFGERIADAIAGFGGSWSFILTFCSVLVVYTSFNLILGAGRAWDPYPFILLNLMLSMIAALQAPVIMMSQNRTDTKDRLRSELDFQVNRRSEAEVQSVCAKLNLLLDKVHDLEELVRGRDPLAR